MGHNRRPGGSYVTPIKQSDASKSPDEQGRGTYALASGTTYLYPVGGADAPWRAFHVQWDALAILTVSVEDSIFGDADVLDTSIALGDWIREDQNGLAVNVKSTDGTTGGATVTASVIAVAGGTAGGAMIHVPNNASKRMRLRVDVGGTGGNVRVAEASKSF